MIDKFQLLFQKFLARMQLNVIKECSMLVHEHSFSNGRKDKNNKDMNHEQVYSWNLR